MLEIFVFSIKMMFKNKMRSFLTMLGIIIGVMSLILIVVFGKSFSKTFESLAESLFQYDQLVILIMPEEDNKNVVYDEYGSPIIPEGISLDIKDVEKQLKLISEDSYINYSSVYDHECKGEFFGRTTKFVVNSVSADMIKLYEYNIIQGRDISSADEVYQASVGVISDVAANILFNGEDPVGKSINMSVGKDIVSVCIVGVYELKNVSEEDVSDVSTNFFVNHSFFENEFAGILNDSYWGSDVVQISMKGISDKDEFKKNLVEAVEPSFNYDGWTLYAYTVSENLSSNQLITGIILKIIFVIAAISLVVGGIGLMNVMLITVTERTSEIGVRKALGADNTVIIYQFLCESFVISLSATIIGVILGFLASKLMALIAGGMLQSGLNIPITMDVSLPLSVILLALLFSLAIGIIFGLYPAVKAVRMQIVDALRYE